MPTFDTTNKTNDTVIELLQVINALVAEVQPNRPSKAITLDLPHPTSVMNIVYAA